MSERAGGSDRSDKNAQNESPEQDSSSRMLFAIAVFKLFKAALLIALGVATLSLAHNAGVLDSMRHWAGLLGFSAHGRLVNRAVSAALGIDHRRLQALSVGTFVYAAIFLVEGAGLMLRKHWAEYLTAIVTASFIPLEVYEMIHKASATKGIGIGVNVAVAVYLVARLWRRRRRANGEKGADASPQAQLPQKSF